MGRATRARRQRPAPALVSATQRVVARPAAAVEQSPRPALVEVRAGLRAVARERSALDVRQRTLVHRGRVEGLSWAELGRSLGITGQAVQMRYGRCL